MICYRKAEESDTHNIKVIAKRVINVNYSPFLGAAAVSAFIESGMSDKVIDEGLDSCVLMICDEQAIGFAITKQNVLHLVMVDVPAQNAGYGTALLSHIEAKLFTEYGKIQLQTFEENNPAVRFYIKNGWVITGQEKVPELNKIMLHFEKTRSDDDER